MKTNPNMYACAIIGGGLAGLSLAIQLADAGIQTIVFEKNTYPFHKVCGEYISMESWNFIELLGVPLKEINVPIISQLGISSQQGFMLHAPLNLGGFGISRYTLDNYLYEIAKSKGVVILEQCRVLDVIVAGPDESIINTSSGNFSAKVVCGSYGKYTPLFAKDNQGRKTIETNYIGVKYHVKANLPSNKIELHNFEGGYCGISKVDNDAYCLCYLANSEKLNQVGNDIKKMEQEVLFKNPFLKKYFIESEFIFDQPLIISNVTFHKKNTYVNSVFLLGDASGSITPLCGNGMSMALRASSILSILLISFFNKTLSKQNLINEYENAWKSQFNTRIFAGYYLQGLFGKKSSTHLALKILDNIPKLTQGIISLTHGKSF